MREFFKNKWVRIGLIALLGTLVVIGVCKGIISVIDAKDAIKATKETTEAVTACIGM